MAELLRNKTVRSCIPSSRPPPSAYSSVSRPRFLPAGPSQAKVDDAVRSGIRSGARTQKIIITVNPGCRAAIVDWGTASSGESDNIVWGTGGGL
jgi:hypothetical protein